MASKRRLRRRACSTKVRHTSAANAMLARRKAGHPDVHPYKCPFCGGWHLGRRSARLKQGITQAIQDRLDGYR